MVIEKRVEEEITKSNQKMNENLLKLKEENETLAQCTRRNCLILHGIKEKNEENTNLLAKIKNLFSQQLKHHYFGLWHWQKPSVNKKNQIHNNEFQ